MSYRTEENAIKWKIRRIRAIVISVIVVIVVAICIFCAFVPPHTWPYYFYLPVVSARQEGELRMHFIDVGQGDCTLIELPDGKTMMIDGGNGEKDNSTAIIRYLKALNIGRLDYLVLTHVDSDHCGGLDDVMSYVSVGTIYYPEEPNAAINSEYAQFYEKLSGASCEKEYNRQGIKLTSSSQSYAYEFVWIWPYGSDNPNADKWVSNEKSAVISLEYAGKKALFVGDAPSKTLQSLYVQAQYGLLPEGISLKDLDLYKVPHHGSSDGINEDFLSWISPRQAIISCGKNNPYGHPHEQALTALTSLNSTVYRTDEKGNILVTWGADGSNEVKTDRQ